MRNSRTIRKKYPGLEEKKIQDFPGLSYIYPIFQDAFPGLKRNPGLSRTFQDFPGLVATLIKCTYFHTSALPGTFNMGLILQLNCKELVSLIFQRMTFIQAFFFFSFVKKSVVRPGCFVAAYTPEDDPEPYWVREVSKTDKNHDFGHWLNLAATTSTQKVTLLCSIASNIPPV